MWKIPCLLVLASILQQTEVSRRRFSKYNAYYLFEERKGRRFIEIINEASAKDENKLQIAEWNYASNLTDENLKKKLCVIAEVADRTKRRWTKLMRIRWKTFWDIDLKRQFKLYSVLGAFALPKPCLSKYNEIVGKMEKIYSTNTICDYQDPSHCNLTLENEIVEILRTSRNEPELRHVWVSWRNGIGPKVKNLYAQYVRLANKAAHLNNFDNNAEMWLDRYEDRNIKGKFQMLWNVIKPLYLQIHAYTRFHLKRIYGEAVDEKGAIPAHLLGNMWAQSWENIARDILPYPEKPVEDITEKLLEQDYTPLRMFKTAENFFISINMSAMPDLFWKNSIIEKPPDRDIICHGSAWDFANGKDFRIKMWARVTEENFIVVHHEMGHVEYYIQYRNQPFPFRSGANPGFHEAIGDLIALSVKSPTHLHKLNLSRVDLDDSEDILNNLFLMGMAKIVLLPFAYIVDQWRWDVFAGRVTPDCYNKRWWELRREIQGVSPPVHRSECDFDPAAKYHVMADTPYIRYFVSFVIQFQFHKALCEAAGEYRPGDPLKPLHMCDIYQKPAAGNLLKRMLQMGASRPWPEAMEILTGQKDMDASALLEYFRPLYIWLERHNIDNCAFVGW
ncbi:angiotensin-converting enzyme-like [Coccinella septempunctata]|uniref:angiotensin-converting enzyme-like n=1 Tax=Coccinella septempunctata TaxID=41139 RepID=UPI001D07D9E8|nr:angiotensin-converting enzyme-like [Coccinella septempunctata]